jgi:hypothetical protein
MRRALLLHSRLIFELIMRRLLVFLLTAFSLSATAQQPPELEPLPEPPPPAVALDEEALAERGVRIEPGERAEEFVAAGKRVIRVTRPNGAVYDLIEQQGGAGSAQSGDASSTNFSVPQWLLFRW